MSHNIAIRTLPFNKAFYYCAATGRVCFVGTAAECCTGSWAKKLCAYPASAAPSKSPAQYTQWCFHPAPDTKAGPKARAGLNAPPDTEPPINPRKPSVKPIAIGANPPLVLPEVV